MLNGYQSPIPGSFEFQLFEKSRVIIMQNKIDLVSRYILGIYFTPSLKILFYIFIL